jgi:hypothetical protein
MVGGGNLIYRQLCEPSQPCDLITIDIFGTLIMMVLLVNLSGGDDNNMRQVER